MKKIKIWHNPNCSKSREAMKIMEENKCESEVIEYLKDTPNALEIKSALEMLGLSAKELMRTKENVFNELKLETQTDETKLIDAMVNNPILIERPVIFKGSKAIIGRPTSIISDFIK